MSHAERLEPRISPHGTLTLHHPDDAVALAPELAARLLDAFARGPGEGLLELGAGLVRAPMPPVWAYFRELAARYVTLVRTWPDAERELPQIPPAPELFELALAAPPIVGAEYLTLEVLHALWAELDLAFRRAAVASGGVLPALTAFDPAWHTVGRVVLNLAENRRDPDYPFAFMATYTTRLSAGGKAQHAPLGQALEEYAGARKKPQLLALLTPIAEAAKSCPWLDALVAAGEIYEPMRWTPAEAAALLRDVPALEAAGLVVRMPATWGPRPPRAVASATVGTRAPAGVGQEALLDFRIEVTLDGAPLTADEVTALLAQTSGLALIRGRWVELDRSRLERALARFEAIERRATEGVSFAEAMRLLARADATSDEAPDPVWSEVSAGAWLDALLAELRAPPVPGEPVPGLAATLRPYQAAGVRWLTTLTRLGLGALLADDMGLGKTVQVLALLLGEAARGAGPSLLVAPATLLGNWASEAARFAPSLRVLVAHASLTPPAELAALDARRIGACDLIVMSYGGAAHASAPAWLSKTAWNLVVLDEAQAVKNPATMQTRAVKRIPARARVALSGTPIENRLGDLWSIFDFVNPGLLGGARQFTEWTKRLDRSASPSPWAPLRELVRPYLLRRRKTDKSVIADLPDKVEVDAWCALSPRQAALYEDAVEELRRRLAESEGIARRGLVLATIMRLKQICNHPSHWLGDGAWAEGDSGKLRRLREILQDVADRQEKVLLFTQFREVTDALGSFAGGIFGRGGLVLSGETRVARRKEIVKEFQEDESLPFLILTIKAGGTGLNLTAASHVVHFDRWWNPAVEDQATDRAFRIGQRKNVVVHKLVCRGTIEERVAAVIAGKRKLSQDVVEGGAELNLTELPDDELIALMRLDLRRAMEEE